MTWTVTTSPTEYPLSITEAKEYLRIDSGEDDALVFRLLGAATDYCEEELDLAIMPQTITLSLDKFPQGREIELPRTNLLSVTSVSYTDTAGDTQAFTDFTPRKSTPAYIVNNTEYWPQTKDIAGAVTIVYQAGFSQIPEAVRQAVAYQVVHFYDQRSPVVIGPNSINVGMTTRHLLHKYRKLGV